MDQIADFTPDDTYSDFTNRVTVTGQSLDDMEISYAEERLGSLNGTFGWWQGPEEFTVWYSTDMSRRAKNPRLQVLESSTGIMFQLSGEVKEGISYIDPNHKYCIVTVTAPNLIPVLLEALGLYVAASKIYDLAKAYGLGLNGGITKPLGRIMQKAAIELALNALGSVVSFQYEIWGCPLGYVKRDYSASANDVELQQQLGMVVEQKHEGFLCYTAADCQGVADFEMKLAQLQRNRVTFSKLAHLKDEVGDVITIPHPYTGNAVKLLINGLTRRYKPAGKDEDGYFKDEVEGWVICWRE